MRFELRFKRCSPQEQSALTTDVNLFGIRNLDAFPISILGLQRYPVSCL